MQIYYLLAIYYKKKPQKQTDLILNLLDFNIKYAIQLFKKIYLFWKALISLPNINKIKINVIKVNIKIIELKIYKKIIRDFIYKTY